MRSPRIRSASQQLADFLKEEIQSRKWTDTMPGESWLVTELGVGRDTVRAALALLEAEGVLVSDGQGRCRRIVMRREDSKPRRIRMTFFLYQMHDRGDIDNSTLLAELLEAGIDANCSAKSLKDLGMDVERVARYVNKNPVDAWVVSAASREVLEWFASQTNPVIAMYGDSAGLPIAAAYPLMIPGQRAAVRRLIELGHKRIVMVTREERRNPKLSRPEQAFINELEAAGIRTGEYNIPNWEETRPGLSHLLNELFRISPPTAMIFQEAQLFIAARSHLADRGIVAPRNVSLVVADRDPSFAWSDPIPAHIEWDYRPVVHHIVRWAKNLAHGKHDRRICAINSEFIEGGTIGPVGKE